jgi:deoxycytidylate deaminase
MFLAYAASFRSGDLSRQVGAAIVGEGGEVLAVGCNDVPRFGGGLYWPGATDERDWKRGIDSNHERRNAIIADVARSLESRGNPTNIEDIRSLLSASQIHDITEYGRAVHAEMDALLSCARVGVSPKGRCIYTTTFPCHNCTRHIVAAGLSRVVYVEPYPKSQATALHGDSIWLADQEPQDRQGGRVIFEPFVGIGARRYIDLFSMKLAPGRPLERKDAATGKTLQWTPHSGTQVRVPLSPISYLERERLAVRAIQRTLSDLGKD